MPAVYPIVHAAKLLEVQIAGTRLILEEGLEFVIVASVALEHLGAFRCGQGFASVLVGFVEDPLQYGSIGSPRLVNCLLDSEESTAEGVHGKESAASLFSVRRTPA